MNAILFDTMCTFTDCGFTFDRNASSEFKFIFTKKVGSVSNGCDVVAEVINKESHGRPYDLVHLKGRVWAFDGDNYEVDNSIDLWIKVNRLE